MGSFKVSVIETGPFEICVRKGGSFEKRPRGRFARDAFLRGWPFEMCGSKGFVATPPRSAVGSCQPSW